MGNMSDEMQKILNKWQDSESASVQQQPAPRQTYRSIIHNYIKDNPGTTTGQVLKAMQNKGLAQTHSSVSSQMTTMFQEFMVRREEGAIDKATGRKIYTYYYVPPLESVKLKAEHLRKKAQAQARAEKARQAKALKAEAKQRAQNMLQEQLALPLALPVPEVRPMEDAAPAPAPQAAPNLRDMSAMDILHAINFAQAKELYKELKEAFGG
jgi:hypothetical protein